MTGYCSNSPGRCSYARLVTKIGPAETCCPECGLALIPVIEPINDSESEQRVLMAGLSITGLLLLVLMYIHYGYVA